MYFGRKAASVYGYSNARVKVMKSRLIAKDHMQRVIASKDPEGMLALLLQTDYKKNLEEFGGLKVKAEQIDFALSKNLAGNIGRLVRLTPVMQRKITRAITGRWDLYNLKLAIDAKSKGLDYSSISRYVIDYGIYNAQALKDALRESRVESLMERLSINSPYKQLISAALAVYRKTGSTMQAEIAIDSAYYSNLGSIVTKLMEIDSSSARILRMEIDMKNLLLLMRAKRYSMDFAQINRYIINNGTLGMEQLRDLYAGSKELQMLVKRITLFDLSKELEIYSNSKNKQLLVFEIGMKNAIFIRSMELLSYSVHSFGAILAYAYLKEIEAFTLRIIINGKIYNLTKEELSSMIVWKT